jgi:hypothetical protein
MSPVVVGDEQAGVQLEEPLKLRRHGVEWRA